MGPLPAVSQEFTAPSGLAVGDVQYLFDDETEFARFRLVAPELGGTGAGIEEVNGDFLWFCETFAVPALNASNVSPNQIVITLADRVVAFGAIDPDATQYFAGFSTDGTTCTEELF